MGRVVSKIWKKCRRLLWTVPYLPTYLGCLRLVLFLFHLLLVFYAVIIMSYCKSNQYSDCFELIFRMLAYSSFLWAIIYHIFKVCNAVIPWRTKVYYYRPTHPIHLQNCEQNHKSMTHMSHKVQFSASHPCSGELCVRNWRIKETIVVLNNEFR